MPVSASQEFFGFHEKVDQLMEEHSRPAQSGAEMVDPANIDTISGIEQYNLMCYFMI